MNIRNINPQAWHALRAAHLRKTAGRYAATKYAAKHGVLPLYRLAVQLAAVSE